MGNSDLVNLQKWTVKQLTKRFLVFAQKLTRFGFDKLRRLNPKGGNRNWTSVMGELSQSDLANRNWLTASGQGGTTIGDLQSGSKFGHKNPGDRPEIGNRSSRGAVWCKENTWTEKPEWLGNDGYYRSSHIRVFDYSKELRLDTSPYSSNQNRVSVRKSGKLDLPKRNSNGNQGAK